MKLFSGSGLDPRAVGAGAAAGAVTMVAVTFGFTGLSDVFDVVAVVVFSFLFASIPAGLAVGILNSSTGSTTSEGGLAAVLATVTGVLCIGLFGTANAAGVPVAYQLDVLFVVTGFGLFTLLFVIPPTFLVGSWAAGATARTVRNLRNGGEEEWGEVGRFRDAEE
ncbi:hypothetical protein BRC61_00610 [Halobacteriales archaeon QH_10_65_19]|jgi:hypothetical protein|nr:MAG: hypothetical protein BRC61_00610 [Halobacteriales archaeon QH_10_65_19]